jgi:hypothetical protein
VDRFLNQHNGRRLYGISGYEGVVWDEKARVWWAEVEMGGRVYPFGPYLDAQVAALVYDAAHQLLKMPPVNFASRSYPSHILTCVIWRFLHPDFLSQQTGFAGVWLVEGHYETWISHAGKIFWVGRFRHVEEAALAYDEARRFLDLSPVNFPGIFCPYNISQHVRYRMKALGIFLIR